MKNTGLVLTVLALLAAFAAPVQGQSLADAARREAQRRARLTAPTKVFTNADVDAVPSRGTAPTAQARPEALLALAGAEAAEAAPVATPSPDAEPSAAATVREKRDEQHWRERAQVIRERLNRLQLDAVALEARVKALGPALDAASGSQKAALGSELQEASTALTRVQNERRLIQDEWRQFEDRAEKAKIPAAWIR